MKKSIYDFCLCYSCGLFGIMGIQTDNTLSLVNNDFVGIVEDAIKSVKIMTKDKEYFTTSTFLLKFNGA